uniref:Uncharacterized protein n=1 Tax=Zea mays TaxID=4577 RepID=C0PKV0_MAIZE|nr:unknown [Zea mays]
MAALQWTRKNQSLTRRWARKNQSLTRKNSNKTKEIKKRTAATMDPEEPVSHPPNHIILQTKSSDPMAALQNPATRMISGENSRQICFELRSPSLLT